MIFGNMTPCSDPLQWPLAVGFVLQWWHKLELPIVMGFRVLS